MYIRKLFVTLYMSVTFDQFNAFLQNLSINFFQKWIKNEADSYSIVFNC